MPFFLHLWYTLLGTKLAFVIFIVGGITSSMITMDDIIREGNPTLRE